MTTDDLMHRLRSYFRERGMNTHQVAVAAGVHWRSAQKVLEDGGNPELDTLRKIESIVPAEYVPPAVQASRPHAA